MWSSPRQDSGEAPLTKPGSLVLGLALTLYEYQKEKFSGVLVSALFSSPHQEKIPLIPEGKVEMTFEGPFMFGLLLSCCSTQIL